MQKRPHSFALISAISILALALLACSVSTGLPLATATSAPAGDTLPTAAATSPVESPANPSGPAQATAAPAGTQPSAAPVPAISLGDFSTAVRQVAGKVKPAVVQITNEQVQLGQFNQPFTTPAGVGSGVIYDQQGHILTNNHVVTGAQRLLVSLPDGRSF
ncbi:MAG TPA: hypothetical protein VF813_02460, partial [Anaerolineaceae bacterium]